MARRTGRQAETSNTENAEAPAEAPTQEDAVTTATPEATVETEPATTETPDEAPKAEVEVDLTEFNAAVEAAVGEADETTGQIPAAPLAKVTEAYRALDGIKAKNKAKARVNELLSDAMNSGNLAGARSYFQISEEALVAGGGSKSTAERTPTDPTEAFTQRVATLNLGYALATQNVPEGVKADWNDTATGMVNDNFTAAQGYLNWLDADEETRGDEPEVPAFVKAAVKLSQGKAARAGSGGTRTPFTGTRRDIGKHIVEVFESKEPGTFLKISEIREVGTSEYKSGEASAGAISARLFPEGDGSKSSMRKVGIASEMRDNKKGAVLVNADGSPLD